MCIDTLSSKFTGTFHFGGRKKQSLYELGETILNAGSYPPELLNGIKRNEEKNGPPRIGDVSLNSTDLRKQLELNRN